MSIHRATTVGAMSGLCQVIIKNTSAFKEVPHSSSAASINRSQSLLTTNRIPIIAPSRAERIRLEALLADVWTRDVLPFPGMTVRARSEHPVRASASSMMRKLSVASIASNFTKRSASFASLQKAAEDDVPAEVEGTKPPQTGTESHLRDSNLKLDFQGPSGSRLSVIQDEKENIQRELSLKSGPKDSPVGTMKRLATLKVSKSWATDGQRIVTPPLRTSSANSLHQNRVIPCATVAVEPIEEKEKIGHPQPAQAPQKQGKWSKGVGLNRGVVAEGIRSLFR